MPTAAANWPVPLSALELRGKSVTLEPLAPEHERQLLDICQDEQIWRYLASYGGTPEAMHEYLQAALRDYASGSALPFVIRAAREGNNGSDGSDKSEAHDGCEGRVIGMTRLKNLSRANRNAVVGSWLVPAAWGSGANTESKLLLLTHAFETLKCIRIEFHTDSRNLRSRAALKKMGKPATEAALKALRRLDLNSTAAADSLDSPAYKARLLGLVIRGVEGDAVGEFILKRERDSNTDQNRRALYDQLVQPAK